MTTAIRKSIIFLFVCLPLFLQAQKKEGKALIDSLVSELPKAKEDTNKVKMLHTLARTYCEFDLDVALKYGNQAMALAQTLGYKSGTARSYIVLGQIYYLEGNQPEAIKSDETALKLYEASGDKRGIAGCYFTMGNSWASKNNYPEAFKNYFAALKIFEQTGDKSSIFACYDNIGAMYHFEKKDSDALAYYSAGMREAKETGDKDDLANFNDNIGGVWFDRDSFGIALKYYTAAFALFEEIGQKNGMANSSNNIGEVYKAQGNEEEAMKKYHVSAKLLEEVGNKNSLGIVYGNIGVILDKQKNFSEAGEYFNKELALGKETGALFLVKEANAYLSTLYEHTGDFKKSLESYKAFIVTRDSMFNKENTEKNVKAQMQYEYDKREAVAKAGEEKKDAVLQLKLQQKNMLIYGTLSAFALLLIIGSLLFRQSKLRASQQRTELEQKQLRAQMNPHFIFNCLNSIQHFVVINDVKNANKYLTGFASLMRQTLENSKEGTITLRKEITYLESYLTLELMRFRDKFTAEIVCAENTDTTAIKIPAMIIQPFIENSIRHGLCYPMDAPGRLEVKFYINGKDLFCEIDDNGIGRAQSQKLKAETNVMYESQGMELTRQRLALVSKSSGADYKIEITDKKGLQDEPAGTTVVIKFPVEI